MATSATAPIEPTSRLTPRQQSEFDFHRSHAESRRALIDVPVADDILQPQPRRPWNAYWSMYDRILAASPHGKRVLVPGCGFGDDAIRLAKLGAEVSTFDISPESVEIARLRAGRCGCSNIDFRIMPAESMTSYAADSFDMVVFVDILHHVDIPATLGEIVRVVKPGGTVIGDELYTNTMLQKIRESTVIDRFAYPLMQRWIYNGETPYITPEEHKIDQHELGLVLRELDAPRVDFFGLAEGRLFPSRMTWASKLDRRLMQLSGAAGKRLGSRVVFSGRAKS